MAEEPDTNEGTDAQADSEDRAQPVAAAEPRKRKKESVPFWDPDAAWRKIIRVLLLLVAVLGVVTVWVLTFKAHREDWPLGRHVVFAVPLIIALVVVALFAWVMRAKARFRANWRQSNPDDSHCRNLLIIFNLSNKALYFPTILTSLTLAVLLWLNISKPETLGGIWLGVFFGNFLVEEYDIDLKAILITLFAVAAVLLWVGYMDWMREFRKFFEKFAITLDISAYLLIASVFALAILYSIVKGAFHYVAVTPNYINIQTGIAETGEQIGAQGFTTRVDAGDLLERLFRFGRIVITFHDTRRAPMNMLVWNIGAKTRKLEAIRATYVVDTQDHTRG